MRLGGLLAFYVEELGRKRQIALFNVDVIASAQMSIVVSFMTNFLTPKSEGPVESRSTKHFIRQKFLKSSF